MDKLEEIEKLEPKLQNLERLIALSNDLDGEVRMRAIEKLGGLKNNKKVNSRLAEALNDQDELVRLESLEAISNLESDKFANDIVRCLKDKSWLVRGNAAVVLSEMGNGKFINKVQSNLKNCGNPEERVWYYGALYNFGEQSYFDNLVRLLSDQSYRIRILAIRFLTEMSSYEVGRLLIPVFEGVLESEDAESVKHCLEEAISELKDQN